MPFGSPQKQTDVKRSSHLRLRSTCLKAPNVRGAESWWATRCRVDWLPETATIAFRPTGELRHAATPAGDIVPGRRLTPSSRRLSQALSRSRERRTHHVDPL